MATVRFDFQEPASVAEAAALLAKHGAAALPVAGGTDLLRDVRLGTKRPEWVISLGRIEELRQLREGADGALEIGPTVTMAELAASPLVRERAPALAEAASRMGSPQVRNRATIGGNLCNARPCADTAPPVIVHGGAIRLTSASGDREVPAAEFITNPGKTLRRPDELLTAIVLPGSALPSGSAFSTHTNRKAVEITITSATAWVALEAPDGPVKEARISLGSVGPTPLAGVQGAAALVGKLPTAEALAEAARATVADSSPIDDFRGSAEFRRHLVEVLTSRSVTRAVERAKGGAA